LMAIPGRCAPLRSLRMISVCRRDLNCRDEDVDIWAAIEAYACGLKFYVK
jgi:hypothetical protein